MPKIRNDMKRKGNNTSNSNSNSNSNSEVAAAVEINAMLTAKQRTKSDRQYRGLYLDPDIVTFPDHVPNGNKSDIVNKILRKYLRENGFL